MPTFCFKAAAGFTHRGSISGGRADRGVAVAVVGQPAPGIAAVLLAGMEVGAQVFAPGLVGFADQAALAEQVGSGALPGAPLPQRPVAAEVVHGLAQRVAQEDRGDAPEPGDAPFVAAAQRLVQVEGRALVLGLLRTVPEPERREAGVFAA